MAFGDHPGPSGEDSDDRRLGRHRARHAGAAPDPYADRRPDEGWRDRPSWRDSRYDDPYDPVLPAYPGGSTDPRGAAGRPTGWPPTAPGNGWSLPEQTAPRPSQPDPLAVYWPDTAREPDPSTADWPLVPVTPGPTAAEPPPTPPPTPSSPEPPQRTRAGRRRATAAPGTTGRAGRNLPAAIGIGILLGGVVLGSLLFWRPAFLAVIAVAMVVGMWEMTRAVAATGARAPLAPLLAGGSAMVGLAWYGGPEALCLGLLLTVLATMVWRLADGPAGYQRDVTAATLIAFYVPFLGGFAALLAAVPADGHLRLLVTIGGVVLSDTGGYVAGVFFGRRPMAPSVSPKKSWEGFAGSLTAAAIGSALLLYFLLDVDPWWGAAYGLAIAAAATLGDLAESMLKRDLGIKDMSNLLPGHGGVMDRLDSILLAVPTSYLLLSVLAATSG
jgi:phosphatidate cytidylyltransferase